MIELFQTNNSFGKLFQSKYSSTESMVEIISSSDQIKAENTVVFFYDEYFDTCNNSQNIVQKILSSPAKKIIYIDSVEIYGFTDRGSVDEDYRHILLTDNGKKREEIYELLKKDAGENSFHQIIILRLPDLLAPGANFFLGQVLDGKSNIIQWPGSTAINHEFIFSIDAIEVIKNVIEWAENDSERKNEIIEFNISGTKYTLEQIAAAINEIAGLPIKIVRYNAIYLFFKRIFSGKNQINFAKNILDAKYLFDKPIFLNSAKYEKQFGEIKKTELYNGLYDIFNG